MTSEDGQNELGQQEDIWIRLAEMVNELPVEARLDYRLKLGEYLHDFRHILGLIVNSEDLIRRDLSTRPELASSMELLDIVRTATLRAVNHLDMLTEGFGNQIDVGEIKEEIPNIE
ncbi:MAG: hypothetical protein OEZ02_04315 [Anaerolineae bacterium]|nr:hypothetical protein [Anaerolineae bacterium]